jgi:hypothetical protein
MMGTAKAALAKTDHSLRCILIARKRINKPVRKPGAGAFEIYT